MARVYRRVQAEQVDEAIDASVAVETRYLMKQTEALDARVERGTTKLVRWQLGMHNLNANQRGTMESRIRDHQVRECVLAEQKEATRQLLQRVVPEAEENQVVRRLASQQVEHT